MHFLQSDSRRFADLCLKKKCYSPLRFWELTECKPELNRIVAVQECDARMFNKIAITGYIKNKFCTAGFFDSLFRNFNSKTICHDNTPFISQTIIIRSKRLFNAKGQLVSRIQTTYRNSIVYTS